MNHSYTVLQSYGALIKEATKYVNGESHLIILNGLASELLLNSIHFKDDEMKIDAEIWKCTINRRWNEWGIKKEPITEKEFIIWINKKLK